MRQDELMEATHESLVNGQRQQMVKQIDEYGSEFWADYVDYLNNLYPDEHAQYTYFADACISYARIKAR